MSNKQDDTVNSEKKAGQPSECDVCSLDQYLDYFKTIIKH